MPNSSPSAQPPRLLAFDTSTDRLSIAVQHGDQRFVHEGEGGAQASAALIPAVRQLLAQAGLTLRNVDAIVFGRGPGSFTGLRTACSVAQGFAYGAGVPVLPVDTLLAVAQEARTRSGATRVLALLDARMNEVYSAPYAWQGDHWLAQGDMWSAPPKPSVRPKAPPTQRPGCWPATPSPPTASACLRPWPGWRAWKPGPRPPRCSTWPRRCWPPAAR